MIYAGTWHLAWKTDDGGNNWHQIKNGVIDDSDVFSLIIDPQQPSTVYLSACSGIYKSGLTFLWDACEGCECTGRVGTQVCTECKGFGWKMYG